MNHTKSVLITGASNGIGKEIAFALAKLKYNIALTYFSDQVGAEQVVTQCLALGAPKCIMEKLNVGSSHDVRTIVHLLKHYHKLRIDIVINNAGVIVRKRAEDYDLADID